MLTAVKSERQPTAPNATVSTPYRAETEVIDAKLEQRLLRADPNA